MTTLHQTNTRSSITIECRPDVDLTRVFSREYFDRIGLSDFHISVKRVKPADVPEIAGKIVQDLEEGDRELSEQFLGNERLPNGYTDLPLKQSGGTIVDTVYDYTQKYLGFFTNNSSSYTKMTQDVERADSVMITFQSHRIQTYSAWKEEHLSNEPSLFSFTGTNITYELLERILRNLYEQVEYLHNYGFTLSDVSTDFVYVLQDKFVLADGAAIQPFDNNQVQDKISSASVLRFVCELLNKTQNDVLNDFAEISNTDVYYVLKRLQDESVFMWA
jgi:hypothetical protein